MAWIGLGLWFSCRGLMLWSFDHFGPGFLRLLLEQGQITRIRSAHGSVFNTQPLELRSGS